MQSTNSGGGGGGGGGLTTGLLHLPLLLCCVLVWYNYLANQRDCGPEDDDEPGA